MNQIELHKTIDTLLLKNPAEVKREDVSILVSANKDAHHYFFAKADERWVDWIWANGFLNAIKQKAEDPSRYGYRMPELNYLVKVAEKEPEKVVDIMLAVPISSENFNPEVIDRFLWIGSKLPAGQVTRITAKIRTENWVRLMGEFSSWGFQYEDILRTLSGAKEYKGLLEVAQEILTVRTREEIEKSTGRVTSDNPFYFDDLGYTGVFKYLVSVDDAHAEEVLELVVNTMRFIVHLGKKDGDDETFEIGETFFLFDVDFFTLELDEKGRLSYRDDVRNLAAVVKQLAVRILEKQCENPDVALKLYDKFFASLPDSRSMWRLRLFVLSMCPVAFRDKLKDAFFRIFREDNKPWGLISGAEYERAVHAGFAVLSDIDKRTYVSRVLEYFGIRERKDAGLWKHSGWSILSSAFGELTNDEREKAEKVFGKPLDPNFQPEQVLKMSGYGSSIVSQAPITKEEFQKLTIQKIVEKLCGEWTPKVLVEKYKAISDFHHPIDAEGVGALIKSDMAERIAEYLVHARLFYDRESLHPHYTYSFLRGVDELLREKKIAVGSNLRELLSMLKAIAASGEKDLFDQSVPERNSFEGWLTGWGGVHNAMADMTKELLDEKNKSIADFSSNRDAFLEMIKYLLKHPDPQLKDEARRNSRGEIEYTGSDPFSEAINSVRGRAYEALVFFAYQDGKNIDATKSQVKIADDVKRMYEELLGRENTLALMFLFGHYLPTFYFRDKVWIRGLLPQIFTQDTDKKDLYLSAWEGFLTNNLFGEMFFDPNITTLYNRGIELKSHDYTKRRYFKDLDEALATHLVLAFIHYPEFNFEHSLFKKFWSTENLKRHEKFVSFMGRHSIQREAAAEWIKINKIDILKLEKFWDWALENCNPNALPGFGNWVNVEKGVLETKWLALHVRKTLEKTKGYIEWEYGLMRSLTSFAKEAPVDTLAILRSLLFEEVAKHEPQRVWFYRDEEIIDPFKILYQNEQTREGVRTLINDLLPYRNGLFWGLKSIL